MQKLLSQLKNTTDRVIMDRLEATIEIKYNKAIKLNQPSKFSSDQEGNNFIPQQQSGDKTAKHSRSVAVMDTTTKTPSRRPD